MKSQNDIWITFGHISVDIIVYNLYITIIFQFLFINESNSRSSIKIKVIDTV